MANIRDVAKEANVSIASVSRILNNDETYRVSPETRAKVFAAVERLQYYPKRPYTKKQYSQGTIAVINNLTTEYQMDHYYLEILSGIRVYLSSKGYSLQFVQSQHDITRSSVLRSLLDDNVCGLILFTSALPSNVMQTLKAKIPHIIGIDTSVTDIDSVGYNTFEAGLTAMNYLTKCGHKRIAFVGGFLSDKQPPRMERFDAYRTSMHVYGTPIDPRWIIDCEWRVETCYRKTQELMKSDARPTALFVASDSMAIVCMNAIRQIGLKIPEDISVIGISDIKESRFSVPPLTTISVPQQQLGECAAETLLQRIAGDKTIVKKIYVPTKLVERNSVQKI